MAKKRKRSENVISYWQSYSDMMAALLLMFVLIMSYTLLNSMRIFEEKQSELGKQKETMLEQQEQLKQQEEQIDQLIGIRGNLIKALSDEFKKTNIKVEIDPQTGSITLDSNVLFDYNEYQLKHSGIVFLTDFLPVYFNVLLNNDFLPYLSEIIIEGHSDTQGDYMYNLELSQKRAFEVASYCLDEKNKIVAKEQIGQLRKMITANGRSSSNPIYNKKGKINMKASRRVEIKFNLKEDEMINAMKKILEE